MRMWTGLAGALAVAGAIASPQPAGAQDWCGFHDRPHSQVRCGYSSLQECQQALGEKKDVDKKSVVKKGDGSNAVVCLPDPASG